MVSQKKGNPGGEPGLGGSHLVTITNREEVLITGVLHVDSFDDRKIILDTDLGTLTVNGEDLNIKQLNLEDGNFAVEGLITSLQYAPGRGARQKGQGFLERLLR